MNIFSKVKKFISNLKFTPSIVIWELVIQFEEDVEQRFYFLSRKRADKFWNKHSDELKDCYHIHMGGVQLWLW